MTRKARRVSLTVVVVLLFTLFVLALTFRVRAQEGCPTHAAFKATLAFLGEEIVGGGWSGEDQVAEFYLSPAGNWTITLTGPDGLSCEVISGHDWQLGEPLLPGEKRA